VKIREIIYNIIGEKSTQNTQRTSTRYGTGYM